MSDRCPFCGSSNIREWPQPSGHTAIRCMACGAQGPISFTAEGATRKFRIRFLDGEHRYQGKPVRIRFPGFLAQKNPILEGDNG